MSTNVNVKVLPSAARTATVDSDAQINDEGRGCHVIINVTSITDTPSVVPKIQGRDPASGEWYDLLPGVAIIAIGMTVLKVYPGIATIVNAAASDILPAHWRVRLEHADVDSITYSVGAVVIV
ncbi:hypothetical protein LCGC14_1331540 [marine sediment metagenome]|uniref:Uncharacterized protein n=2 Tax=marine sediment metagenome TaxID=412755 RepID=A0A0F9L2I7_9ZZZZ